MQTNNNIFISDKNPLLIIRQHYIYKIFIALFLWISLFISIIIMLLSDTIITILWGKIFWLILSLFWIISLAIAFIFWINSELDIIILTEDNIVALKQNSFLNREHIEIDYSKIQEIKSQTIGILPTLFNYGKITIKTATGSQDIQYNYIWNPSETIKNINTIIQTKQKIL